MQIATRLIIFSSAICADSTTRSRASWVRFVEYFKAVASGEFPSPLAVPTLKERLAARRAEVEKQCTDPLVKYNQPPQGNQTFIPRTRVCDQCGGEQRNEPSDHMMYTCAKWGLRVSINLDYAPSVGPGRAAWLREQDEGDRFQRAMRRCFGRFVP